MPNDSKNLPYNYPDQSEEKVYQPSWGLFANQDIPFKDGISGSINITITAQTNICVGGEQIKNEDEPNVTQFYKLPDGQYAIPWSSVKGMVRSLMKAATFGRADQVTDEYSGIRRRPAGANTSDYNRLRDEVNDCLGYGFIKKNNDAEPVLIEYTTYEKISYENLSQAGFTHNASIEKKYKWYAEQKNNNQHLNELKGKLVFGTHCGARENEHLFSNPVEDKPILLTKEQFKRFSDTYIKQDKSQRRAASQCPWQSYWKNQYEQGQEVPVFLFKDGRNNIKHISMTKLPKFASNYSTHDMLKKVNPQHLENVDFDTHLP
ncbi:MAG: hypothetical protein KBT50_05065, partial [Cycloclasticus sp.]|nr:hypothetical protein [Cycloclasticus sp.]